MKKIIKFIIFIVTVGFMVLYTYFIAFFDEYLMTYQFYYGSKIYLVAMGMLETMVLIYVLWFVKKLMEKTIAFMVSLLLYSILTVSIAGSSVFGNGYENVFFPFIVVSHTKTVGNGDFELSDCEVGYFFYEVSNQYNKKRLFRGFTSIAVPSLCDKNINSPSYSKDAERVQ